MATKTGPHEVSTILPIAYGTVYPRAGRSLCASSWIARSAAVIVPAPEHAPRTMTGFIFNTYRPNKIETVCGRTAITRPTKTRLIPDFWSPEKKLVPAASPTQAIKTVKPTVSKIHMADTGIRPNVG